MISALMTLLRLMTATLLLSWALTSTAQTSKSDSADPEPVIELVQDASENDGLIKSRLDNIFAVLTPLSDVTVSVDEGIVTLTGETANDAAAQQARDLAIRIEGVTTVQDNITRTLAIGDNIQPLLKDYQSKALDAYKALPLIGIGLLLFIAFALLGGFIARRERLWRRIAPNPFLAELLSGAARIAFVLIGAILALNLLGAGGVITTLLGGAGVVGIAIGFAVRDSMENYISSIMLSLRQPFRAKDHVIINDKEGIVVRLTSRATILMTMDGNHLRIPNSTVFKGIILNYTTNPERRFDFELGVGASDDPLAAMQTALEAMDTLPFILSDPEPGAVIQNVGDSNIVLLFTGWIDQNQTNFGKARSLTLHTVMQALIRKGFDLPEPSYRIVINNGADASAISAAANVKAAPKKEARATQHAAPTLSSGEGIMDVSPETHLTEKVEEEIAAANENDLLDLGRPHE